MTYITLDEAKDQCSVGLDETAHDARLTRLIKAAEEWASGYLNAELSDYEDSPATSPPSLPEDIKSAILLHVEAEFDRDMTNFETLLKRAETMLWPHRVGLGV